MKYMRIHANASRTVKGGWKGGTEKSHGVSPSDEMLIDDLIIGILDGDAPIFDGTPVTTRLHTILQERIASKYDRPREVKVAVDQFNRLLTIRVSWEDGRQYENSYKNFNWR